MANGILKIREIGLQEVSRKTHIEAEYLEYMCENDFEKLRRLNTLGYVRILSREYGLDLQDWYENFKKYCDENATNSDTFCVSPKIPVYSHKTSPVWIWIGLFFVVIFAGIWFLLNSTYVSEIKKLFLNETNQSTTYSDIAVVKKLKENLVKENKIGLDLNESATMQIVINYKDKNSSKEQNLSNSSQILLIDEPKKLEENLTKNEVKKSLKTTLVPKKRIWIGIVNLENGQKRSLETSQSLDFDLDKEQLITTGHGLLSLQGDSNSSFNSLNSMKFHIKNGEIKQISHAEFLKLNGGKAW